MSAPAPRRILLGAFGDPGHAFPMIALGRGLLARGHQVTLQTWERWRPHVEAEGMSFAPAPEYDVFPIPRKDAAGRAQELDFYEAIIYATRDTLPLVRELRPQVVVSDILTIAPSLAGELHGAPCATLIPHVFPQSEDGFPIYSFGARLPRTALGRSFWRFAHRPVDAGLRSGRDALNRTRAAVGLPALAHSHGGTSRRLALVASFPQLEYPRRWPKHVHVIGPLLWEPKTAEVELPPGDDPLVLLAPSTSQDPDHRLLTAALKGLADAPVRVLATWNRRLPSKPLAVPQNAKVLEWVSYSQTMPSSAVVVCHAGHGTLAKALSHGCAVVACPVAGDMNENAARVAWAGAGLRIPSRLISPRPLKLAVVKAIEDASIKAKASALAQWSLEHDAATIAAPLIEALA